MRYTILFLLIVAVLAYQALIHQGVFWLLLWPAFSLLAVAAAYLGLGPGIFGKTPTGTLAWHSTIVLLPYLLLAWTTWHLIRTLSREPCWNKVAPGMYVGRRPLHGEVPEEVSLVVDLTAEFVELTAVHTGRKYVSAPMLDGVVPPEDVFFEAVEAAANWSGAVYIHCAQGHGRTGIVAAAALVARGHASDADEAMRALCAVRPRLTIDEAQLRFLRRVCHRRYLK